MRILSNIRNNIRWYWLVIRGQMYTAGDSYTNYLTGGSSSTSTLYRKVPRGPYIRATLTAVAMAGYLAFLLYSVRTYGYSATGGHTALNGGITFRLPFGLPSIGLETYGHPGPFSGNG